MSLNNYLVTIVLSRCEKLGSYYDQCKMQARRQGGS